MASVWENTIRMPPSALALTLKRPGLPRVYRRVHVDRQISPLTSTHEVVDSSLESPDREEAVGAIKQLVRGDTTRWHRCETTPKWLTRDLFCALGNGSQAHISALETNVKALNTAYPLERSIETRRTGCWKQK